MSSLLLAALLQGAVEVSVKPSTLHPALGEVFTVTVRAIGPAGARLRFPDEVVTEGVELLPGPPTTEPGARIYRAQVFALDDAARIPEITVSAEIDGERLEGRSAPIPVSPTRTIPPGEENPAPAALAPPVAIEHSPLFWGFHGAWIAALAAALFLLWRRRRPETSPATPQGVDPEEEARLALDRLTPLAGVSDARAFYINLVRVAKLYLERRLAAPVLEMTSQETHAFARAHAWTEPYAAALREVASAADRVKFGGGGDANSAERHWAHVRALVEGVASRHREFEAVRAKEEQERRAQRGRGRRPR